MINTLRRIIQYIANFRDMRRMVALLEEINDTRVRDDGVHPEADGEYYPALSGKEGLIKHYAKLGYSDEANARKIYGDLSSKRYGYVRERNLETGGRVIDVTSAGGDLIKSLRYPFVPTGMWKEIIDKNYKLLTLFLTLVGGIIIGGVGVYITYKAYLKP